MLSSEIEAMMAVPSGEQVIWFVAEAAMTMSRLAWVTVKSRVEIHPASSPRLSVTTMV
jgi:hypothetical protein